MKTVAFLTPPFGISGGFNVILQWAKLLGESGDNVYLAVPTAEDAARAFHFLSDADQPFKVCTVADLHAMQIDLLLGTWWETWKLFPEIKARSRAYLVQSLEGAFYDYGAVQQEEYARLVSSGVPCICIANWLGDYLIDKVGIPASKVKVVVNAFDRDVFLNARPKIEKKPGTVRFLVEGPHVIKTKGIPETLAMLNDLGAEYIWAGSLTDPTLIGPHCKGLFTAVPYREMPSIYASADVIVKLSSIEGMFGPPLEMFATGGTALCWDVWGSDEYMSHCWNSVLAPMHSLESAREWISYLMAHPDFVYSLQANARRTAECWPSWSDLRKEVYEATEYCVSLQQDGLNLETLSLCHR